MTDPASPRPPAPRRSRFAWVGPLVAFGLSCLVFEASTEVITLPPAWRTFEFCQYAEIGRNIAQEGRYDTRLMEPMALAMIDRDQVGPKTPGRWPVVNRYPLPCFVIAGLMRAFGATDRVAAWSNGLAIGILAAVLYAGVRGWFGARWAVLVLACWLLNPSFYGEFILIGTPDVWFAAIFLVELLVWARLDPAEVALDPRPVRWRWAVVMGVLAGLAYLARFNASVFVAAQVAILGVVWRRWREAIVMGGTALVVVVPSLLDTYRHFGRPTVSLYSAWNLLDGIGAYRVEPWLYYKVPDFGRELAAHAAGAAHKFSENLRLLAGPRGVWSLWRLEVLIPLGVVGVWAGGARGSRYRRATGLALAFFVGQLILFSGLRLEVGDPDTSHNGRYFFWFGPFAVALGVATLRWGAARWGRAGKALLVAVVGVQLVVFGLGWEKLLRYHLHKETNLGTDPVHLMLREVVGPDRVIASTHPQTTAWFGGLRSISLPADPDEVARLNRESPTPADYLLVDTNFPTIDLDRRWALLVSASPQRSPFLAPLLREYRYVLPPEQTWPLGYVFLRRSGLAPSAIERQFNPR